jgi:selenide,water dikinase
MVGTETADDAAVYRINERQAVVVTTDFFMPIVDDPFDFGRIAATNALSDVYAMGAKPVLALALVGMPINKLPIETIQSVLAGGAAVCAEAGIPLAGGHSIDSLEPIYGLVAVGLADPARVTRNSSAQAGDQLILTKPLGVGIYSAALKHQKLGEASYQHMLASTTQLNSVGAELPDIRGVHAVTDVTGFGLLGHLLEMCRGAALGAEIDFDRIPLLPEAQELAQNGIGTGAAKRNWASYGDAIGLCDSMLDWQRGVVCDPQTSGGLLIACSANSEPEVMNLLKAGRFANARNVGVFVRGPVRVKINC